MDSNRNNRENNNVNKGNIINLSNLNNAFSYKTDKYSCVYVNKRENSKRYEKDNNNKSINLNLLKYRTSRGKKETNSIEKLNLFLIFFLCFYSYLHFFYFLCYY